MDDYEWFTDEVDALAVRLGLGAVTNCLGDDIQQLGQLFTQSANTHSTAKVESTSPESSEQRGHSVPMATSDDDGPSGESMAFEIRVTPKEKLPSKSPVLRNKKKPTAPRPHTVHIETRSGEAIPTDETVIINRNRTYSDPMEQEQDENRPPNGPAVAFDIGDSNSDKIARNRDRMLRKQMEREELLRRKKLEHEDKKRSQAQAKIRDEEYQNEIKRLDQIRRKQLLENHRQKQNIPASPAKVKKTKPLTTATIPVDPFSPSRTASRSQSTMSHHRKRDQDQQSNAEWDTMSMATEFTCVSTMTTTPLFRQPSTKSNKSLMLMALKYHCLPGQVNATERKLAQEAVENSPARHFMALYKQNKYKGLYEVHSLEEMMKICRIHGTGPKEVTETMIDDLLKYNSGLKKFQSIGSKTLSPSVDGFELNASCYKTKRTKPPLR